MPAMDMEGVGRMALVADPQGVPFYVMRGESDEPSTSFAPMKPGHCSWNELSTPDQDGALAFYTGRFGWEKGDVMPMGEMGGYQFIHHDGGMIGAIMTSPPGRPAGWNFAFGVPDIDDAAAEDLRRPAAPSTTARSRFRAETGWSWRAIRRAPPSWPSAPANSIFKERDDEQFRA